MKKLNISLSS